MVKLINISQLASLLNLVNSKTKKPSNYILRYWEKEFKQIKPKKINNRRYYSPKQVEIIKKINFLLKNQGMTIPSVKKILDANINKLDGNHAHSLNVNYYLKVKSINLLKKVKKLKNYGKKNSSKS